MAKKYIDVECKHLHIPKNPFRIPDPEKNLIFCYQWFDTNYDIKAEDMGNFYDAGYIKGDEVVWVCENTCERKIKFDNEDEFMEKVEREPFGVFNLYLNKHKKKDIKVIINGGEFMAIYKDKYRFKI